MCKKSLLFALILAISTVTLFGQAKPASPPPAAKSASAASSTGPDVATMNARIEKFLRITYAWGPEFDIKIGPPMPALDPELLTVPITVSMGGQSDSAEVFVSKDGKFMMRGEISDLTVDPLAETRSELQVGNSPTKGPANAKVTVIEFGDLECPSCRELESILREVLPENPDIRFVFKHFPLVDIHPWAMAAAIASQCAYDQNPDAFWRFHDTFYDTQDATTPDNLPDKVKDLALQAGLNEEKFQTCLGSPEAKDEVEMAMHEGQELKVNATPTVFVNGRRIVGPDRALLEQFIQFDRRQ
jgi:protein-disulfide isomerase